MHSPSPLGALPYAKASTGESVSGSIPKDLANGLYSTSARPQSCTISSALFLM